MAQLDFSFNRDEQLALIKFALANGCHIVPDGRYSQPHYIPVSDMETYLDFHQQNPLLFLTNKAYSQYPLEFGSFKKRYSSLL